MSVVVTGAFGHLGVNLLRALAAQGRDVLAVDLGRPPIDFGPSVRWTRADIRDPRAMSSLLAGASVVFHLAAVISVSGGMGGRVVAVNVDGVRTVARAALAAGVQRFVHCSSVHAYDLIACRGTPVTEDSPRALDPRLPAYDRSKAAGEAALQAVVADGLPAVIVNPSGVIGPLDLEPSRMGSVLLSAAQGRLPATIAGGFDWVDVRDVVHSLLAAERAGVVGENYLLGGHPATVAELTSLAATQSGQRAPLVDLPMWFARIWSPLGSAIARHYPHPALYTADTLNALASMPVIDHSKATRVLGHDPRPLDQTVHDLLAAAADPDAGHTGAWRLGDSNP